MFLLTYISICVELILSHIYKYIYIHNHIIGVDSLSLCLCSSSPARQRLDLFSCSHPAAVAPLPPVVQ